SAGWWSSISGWWSSISGWWSSISGCCNSSPLAAPPRSPREQQRAGAAHRGARVDLRAAGALQFGWKLRSRVEKSRHLPRWRSALAERRGDRFSSVHADQRLEPRERTPADALDLEQVLHAGELLHLRAQGEDRLRARVADAGQPSQVLLGGAV